MTSVQLPVQLPCSYRATSVSATPCLPIGKLHACTRAARLTHGIGSWLGQIIDNIPFIGGNSKAGFQLLIRTCALASKDHPLGPSAANTLAVTQPWPYSALACLPALRPPLAWTRLYESPTGFAGSAVFPSSSQPLIDRAMPSHNPLCRSGMQLEDRLSESQKDIYAHALSRPSTLLEGKTREASVSEPPAKRGSAAQHVAWPGKKTPTRWPAGENRSRPDHRPFVSVSRRFSPKFGPACPEKVELPLNPAFLTQGRCRIRQIGFAASWERADAQTHHGPFLSHGGSMS
jgi:hypothetical protein